VSIVSPPLPKDITKTGKRSQYCANIDFTNPNTFVTKSYFSNGFIFMSGIDYLTQKGSLVCINDSECYAKSKYNAESRTNTSSKFWGIRIGDNKQLLDIQRRSPE